MSRLKKIIPNLPEADLKDYVITLFGVPKSGKTILAQNLGIEMYGTTEKSLLIGFEDGYKALPGVMAESIKDWSDFKDLVDDLDEYESRNRRAVQVKNVRGLYSNIRNRDVSGDIFNLVSALIYDKWDRESQSEYAGECARWIEEEFGLEDTGERRKKVITNTWLKEIKSIRTSLTNEKLPVSIMNE